MREPLPPCESRRLAALFPLSSPLSPKFNHCVWLTHDACRDDTPDAQSQVVDGMYKMRSLADNTKTLNDLVTKPFPNDCRALQQHKQLSDIEKLLGVDKSKGKKKGKKRKGDPDR